MFKSASTSPNYMQQAQQQLGPLFRGSEIAAQEVQAKTLEAKAAAEAAAAAAKAQTGRAWMIVKVLGGLGVLLGILYLIDYISVTFYNKSVIGLFRVIDGPDGKKVIGDSILTRLVGGGSSGDLLPSLQDSTKETIIAGKDMPLSSDKQGGYGMQWWMFVNDWNYGYGKDKGVLMRADATNKNISNPNITLHPTKNTLKFSISVFPETEGGSSTTQPGSTTGSSASTDDVYICEVNDIPLQTWFSVSMSVFSRNLDVYIDGKLVKSCFLSGIPKPAIGDIILSQNGGFSGYMCNFNYYARMLTPGDASNFFSTGTDCRDKVPNNGSGGGTLGTGYLVKLGFYNTDGKVVKEYGF